MPNRLLKQLSTLSLRGGDAGSDPNDSGDNSDSSFNPFKARKRQGNERRGVPSGATVVGGLRDAFGEPGQLRLAGQTAWHDRHIPKHPLNELPEHPPTPPAKDDPPRTRPHPRQPWFNGLAMHPPENGSTRYPSARELRDRGFEQVERPVSVTSDAAEQFGYNDKEPDIREARAFHISDPNAYPQGHGRIPIMLDGDSRPGRSRRGT
ncbi:hypothetical protein JCM10212_002538 [Sporobolomyces blumeae]